jgi:hypothetical protein
MCSADTWCLFALCLLAGLANLPIDKIDMIFNKVAGPDQKVDKSEFSQLVNQLLKAVNKDEAAAAPAQ